MSQKKPVIFLMGPTATGKTALSLVIGKQLPIEIISVDSTLVYRGMDIGTAKPSAADMKVVPHHLIDIIDPSTPYSAGQFCQDTLNLIPEIHNRNKIPCLVGGTMLYFYYLLNGYAGMPTSDASVRQAIMKEGQLVGWPTMWDKLNSLDPQRAAELHQNDKQRIARALELYTITNQKNKEIETNTPPLSNQYKIFQLALEAKNRDELHRRIELRFKLMLDEGFLDEAKSLYARKDCNPQLPALRTVGYRQAWQHLHGELSYDEFIERAIIATRQLAKRQQTWLNKFPDATRIDYQDTSLTNKACEFLTSLNLRKDIK